MRGLISAVALAVTPAIAETGSEPYRLPLLETTIELDGRMDESAWDEALVVELSYETRPGENVAPPAETECRLFYTETHLYYGCHASDPEPEKIRARYADRDRSFPNDDVIGIAVDPFNSQNRAFVFDVNPLGVQNDRVFTEASGRSDESWDAIWDSAGRLVDDGYVVEVAIPFSSLRFPATEGDQTWGISVRRYMPREVFRRLAIRPFDRSNPCRLCQNAKIIGFDGVDPGRSLEVTPTLTGVQSAERTDFPDGELDRGDPDFEPGLSMRWGVTNNLQLGATLNPDFSQVEADEAQLDVNEPFALFFPELRPFFLEGAEAFRTPIRTVFTRTVADPSFGLKLTGKQGKNALGTFVARDEVTNLLIPGVESSDVEELDFENTTSVLRYARDVGDSSSTVGMVLTDRRGGDYSNTVGGIDAFLRLGKADRLEVQYLRSETEYPTELARDFEQQLGAFSGDALWIAYEHEPRDWSISAEYMDVSDGFRADSGFLRRSGFREAELEGGYKWFGDADHWYTEIWVGAELERSETQDGELLEEEYQIKAGWDGQMQSALFVAANFGERTFEGLRFDNDSVEMSGSIRPARWIRLGFDLWDGDGIDFEEVRPGDEFGYAWSIRTLLGRHFKGDLVATRQELDVEGGNLFTADLAELRLVYQLNARAFFRLISQYVTVERDPTLYTEVVEPESDELFGQLLFSYKIDARTALWLGYTANYLDEARSGLTETGNSVFFKVSYAWQP